MKRTTLALAALFCLLLAAHAASAKDTWTSVRSQNFHLVGNASEKDIRRVAVRLEQFRDVFTRLFTKARFNSPVPTTVVVFKNDSAYKPFKPVVDGKVNDVAGYFQPGEDVNYITLTPESRSENPYRTIYHEYVHLLVENTMGRTSAPPWFNEGLAEYYSTFEIDDDRKVFLGRLIENHLYLLRQEKLIPLRQLFEVDYYSLHRNNHDARGLFYAQSWALIHYLVLGNEGRRMPQVGQFVDMLRQQKPTEQAFREAFQTDFAGMEKELKKYVEGHSFRAQVATFERKLEFDSAMTSAPLTDAEADAYLGDLLLHTNRLDDAAARLEQALKLDPNQAMARASLGMTRLRQKRFDDAREHLRQAVAADARNYLAHYYYAYTLSREGMDEGGSVAGYDAERAREMRSALKRAAELKPDFPETYHLLAWVNLVTGEQLAEGVELLRRALALSPGNQHYALVLAQIHLRRDEFDAARQTVEPLAGPNADPQTRASARSIMTAINVMQEQAARLKEVREASALNPGGEAGAGGAAPRLRRRGETDEPQPAGKSEEELVADALASAINDALRKPLEGETRARGLLARVECDSKGIVFVFKVGERQLRLRAAGFADLHIMSYAPDAGGDLTCGPRKPEGQVVVTYRPAAEARSKSDGSLVALEFVPANFTLRQ